MNPGLAGKTVIVTGATSNIGRATALMLAAEQVNLLAVGRDSKAGDRLKAEAISAGAAQVVFLPVDLLAIDAGEQIANAAIEHFGSIDVLVNGVGGNHAMGLFAESDPALWQRDLDINLMAMLRLTHAVLPTMIKQQSGRLINIGSTAGDVGDYMLALYSAAKGAVHTFSRVLAKEVGQHNITVNCVAPFLTLPTDASEMSEGSRFHPKSGFFTRALADIDDDEVAKLQRTGPLPRSVAKPEEVAAAILYLASNQAAFVTGQILYVDGGVRL